MLDSRCLTMHQDTGGYDLATEVLDDTLMAEAHAKHRDRPREGLDHR